MENKSKIHQIVDPGNLSLSDEGFNFSYLTYKDLHINSTAMYSVTDACIAIETVNALANKYPFTDETIREGIKDVYMPCRMDFVRKNPLVLIDGAHNPEGVKNLKTAVENIANGRNVRIVFACFKIINSWTMQKMQSIIVWKIILQI